MGSVFRVDAALDRMAPQLDLVLADADNPSGLGYQFVIVSDCLDERRLETIRRGCEVAIRRRRSVHSHRIHSNRFPARVSWFGQ